MRKLLGYIPLDPGEDVNKTCKETDVIKIEDQWFKLSEVWIPGVANLKACSEEVEFIETKCGVIDMTVNQKSLFESAPDMFSTCKHCGKVKAEHINFKICPV